VVYLFEGGGVKVRRVTHVDPIGFGKIQHGRVSVFDNFPHKRRDMAELIISSFHQGIGVYRSRIFETFSPIYWIEFIIYLPRNILKFIGVDTNKISIKIIQVIYCILSVIIVFIYSQYKSEINIIVSDYIERLIK